MGFYHVLYHIIKNLFLDKKPANFNFEKFIISLLKDRELVDVFYSTTNPMSEKITSLLK